MKAPGLTHVEHRIWSELLRLSGPGRRYFGSYSQLASIAQCSQASVLRAMKTLLRLGLIMIESKARGRRGATLLILGDDWEDSK